MNPWRVFVLVRREAAAKSHSNPLLVSSLTTRLRQPKSQPEPKPDFVDDDNGDKQQMIPSVLIPRGNFNHGDPPTINSDLGRGGRERDDDRGRGASG